MDLLPPFDPRDQGFVKLEQFQFPGEVQVFELRNHACVDGTHDNLRLNYYLSKDHDFVTVWWGLLDPFIAEEPFHELLTKHELSLASMYNEPLFRGTLATNTDAAVILRATGVVPIEKPASRRPQVLMGAPSDLRCEDLPAG